MLAGCSLARESIPNGLGLFFLGLTLLCVLLLSTGDFLTLSGLRLRNCFCSVLLVLICDGVAGLIYYCSLILAEY